MKNTDNKLQEMQILEQNLQNLLLQKQAFNMELSETQSALKEIENAGEEIFKIIGQLMLKTNKSRTKQDLTDKEKILNLRVKAIEKQESYLVEKLNSLREEILKTESK